MNSMNTTLDRKGLFHVRPGLLLFCAAFVLLLVCSLGPLPDLIRGPFAQGAILLVASAAIAVGCDNRRLREVRICLSKELRFRDCTEIDQRTCRREQLVMPPVRGG